MGFLGHYTSRSEVISVIVSRVRWLQCRLMSMKDKEDTMLKSALILALVFF